MTNYLILPRNPVGPSVEFESANPAITFRVIEEKAFGDVDVLEDGKYAFSCERIIGADWRIYKRYTPH